MHEFTLIRTLAAAFTAAWLLGLLTQRLGLSPIVGYLLAGVLIGPHTPGFSGDVQLAQQLAEIGVILLMFGVGLHFRLRDLISVRSVAVPGAIVQLLVATLLAIAIFGLFGFPLRSRLVMGMALAVASTVVLIRVLTEADALETPQGRIAVGWLIAQDLFMVVLLVLVPLLAGDAGSSGGAPGAVSGGAAASASVPVAAGSAAAHGGPGLWKTLGLTLLKLAALVAVILLAVSRVVPRIMMHVARLRSRELFTLTILVFSIAIAVGSSMFFGASVALGAFLAGIVVSQSPVSHRTAAEILPLRDAFAVLFFVSVGMLFDPGFLLREPLMTVAALGIVLVANPLTALLLMALRGQPARSALTVALGFGQIGEFSFILAGLARGLGLMSDSGYHAIVASAILSISLNPITFRALPRIEAWMRRRPFLWNFLNARAERRATAALAAGPPPVSAGPGEVAIVAGYGPVGRAVHRLLKEAGLETVVIDLSLDTVLSLQNEGQPAIYGDASEDGILERAGVRRASHFVLALPHSADRAAIVRAVRELNPRSRILVRAHYLGEREELERSGATAAVFEEAEAAVALARLVLADTGVYHQAAERKIGDLRMQLIMDNVSNIRTQRVRSVMVPWTRVRHLHTRADRDEILGQVAQERFSRWPVVDPKTGHVTGYLLTKDLIAHAGSSDWLRLLRPMPSIGPDDSIESTLARMQSEAATVFLVEEEGRALGLITQEDILEQVVGRIEDEYPHEAEISLRRAVENGGILLDMSSRTHDQAIEELAGEIPRDRLPPGSDRGAVVMLTLAREAQLSTDLGHGVAVPHCRVPGLVSPIVVFGRSQDGIAFSPGSAEQVHLLFLLLTSAEHPELQLSLLSQIATLVRDGEARDAIGHASSPAEVLDILPGQARVNRAGK